jgi:hypothetical protein
MPFPLGFVASSRPSRQPSGVEVMAAAIGVERAEQAMLANHFAQGPQHRCRPFLLDQEHRVDIARRIVHRHNQVHRGQAFDPGVARPVLVQQHARKQPTWTLLAVRRTLRCLAHQARCVQGGLRHRVAQHMAMPLLRLLVEVLHRESAYLSRNSPSIRSSSSSGARRGERRPMRRSTSPSSPSAS